MANDKWQKSRACFERHSDCRPSVGAACWPEAYNQPPLFPSHPIATWGGVESSRVSKGAPSRFILYFGVLVLAWCLLICFSVLDVSGFGRQVAPPPSRIDPKAQALLDHAIQALGGPAFLRFKTLTTTGRTFSIAEGVTAGFAQYESEVEYPDKRRFAYGSGKKKPIVLVNNGDRAWELDRMGLTSQTPEQVRRWKITNYYSLENSLRLRIREPGVLIQEGGSDFVDNLATRVVDIIDSHHVNVKVYLNRVDFLPVRIAYRVQNPSTEEWENYADAYSDYRSTQGIQTPMHISRLLNDERIAEIFRNSAQYDENYPPKNFDLGPE